ncbi:MAG: TonB-dependent receptor [Chthoniobacter sp.]
MKYDSQRLNATAMKTAFASRKWYLLAVAALLLRPAAGTTNAEEPAVTQLPEVDVVAHLDQARDEIVPSLGATSYTITRDRLTTQSQGEDAPFNQTILRLPGVAQDSFGQLHIRGEHANLQYRINDVLIPEGISGFGQELDTRFVDNLSLITGALPAQFGYRTAGIVDIHTKSGISLNGGDVSLYGGSYDTLRPSFDFGGSSGKLSYFFTGSFLHSDLGIENPTSSTRALHDYTEQYKGFGDISYVIDSTSRLNLMLSASYSDFQIPNNPDQPVGFTLDGVKPFNSGSLDENQHEQNYYAILSYQKSLGDLDFQFSAFTRYSGVLFTPDTTGDLIFNGVASHVDRSILSNGFQLDASYKLGDRHTLRGGLLYTAEIATVRTNTTVFATDDTGAQSSSDPFSISDNSHKNGYLYGVYLQDQWKLLDRVTVNFGGRFDVVNAYTNENQFSPRINLVYTPTDSTTLHAGYARYFTPPPLELVQQGSVTKFNGTTNASEITASSPVRAESAHYFDAGITQKFGQRFSLGLDGYYKKAHNQLDEGQFGSALIFSPFNYKEGEIYGAELTANYQQDNFSAYANLAYSHATGQQIVSGEFQFEQAELDYINKHSVFLDHDQRLTGSFGISYQWNETRFSADCLYGSGLRRGFANTQKMPAYATANIGIEHRFKLGGSHSVKARFDVVNLFDQVYELRDGSGIGVGAPQFGARRGFYGGLSFDF